MLCDYDALFNYPHTNTQSHFCLHVISAFSVMSDRAFVAALVHHCQVLHFPPMRFSPSMSGHALSGPPFLVVCHRQVSHFQSPRSRISPSNILPRQKTRQSYTLQRKPRYSSFSRFVTTVLCLGHETEKDSELTFNVI